MGIWLLLRGVGLWLFLAWLCLMYAVAHSRVSQGHEPYTFSLVIAAPLPDLRCVQSKSRAVGDSKGAGYYLL